MDIHVHGNPRLHYGHNGYHQAPHPKEDGLQFLSLEEKECILFFEETIDSLDEGIEDEGAGLSSERNTAVENLQTAPRSAVNSAPTTTLAPSLIEHDIIDLVHSKPDFTMPDFQSLAAAPQTHFEIKPKTSPTEGVSGMATGSDASEESSYQPPPGSIPTPVIIASKIAEHQGTSGTSSSPSVLVQRRESLESPRCGPPTHAKPHRLPDNINMMLGNRDPTPQSIATAAVNMQERRSQMLANLPPSAHPLEGGEPACVRNPPSRSVSFKDPALDNSRMEALSMLGLSQSKTLPHNMTPVTSTKTQSSSTYSANKKIGSSAENASNSGHTYSNIVNNVNISPNTTVSQKNSSPYKVSSSATASSSTHTYSSTVNNVSPNTTMSQRKNSSTSTSSYEPKAKGEMYTSNFNSYGGKSAVISPASTDTLANPDKRSSTAPAPVSAEVTHSDFNSYGGKTIVLNPTSSFRADSSPSTRSVKPESEDTQINSYGVRSRVINPTAQTDLPDGPACRPRSHSSSPSSTITASTPRNDPTSPTGSKSRIFPPAKTDGQHYSSTVRDKDQQDVNNLEAKPKAGSPLHPDPVYQPVGRSRPGTVPPAPAPRPQWHTGSLRPRPDPISQEIRSKPSSKPSFRTQGITVQFSGKGATDEARRDALRKLGLLKNTS
ncbi:hypothetical protein NFI96_010958 [Prochilodus magdalenae]|nr:hypothetical protein NFI96_010958 [Prochilodus magdalenae]